MGVQTVNGGVIPVHVCGFEMGKAINAPTDGNIVIDTTSKRSGTYGAHVTALSGVKSTLSFDALDATATQLFTSGYFKIVSMPSVARIICGWATSIGTTTPGVYLKTDGKLSVESSASGTGVGTVYFTSSASYNDGAWHQIEMFGDKDSDKMRMRIDGVLVMDWTSIGASAGAYSGFTIGAIDTLASAMEIYWDDIVMDMRDWPGPGYVAKILPNGAGDLVNAGATVTGAASKWEALADTSDASYVTYVGAISESYAMEDTPSSAIVKAMQIGVRWRAATGSSTSVQQGVRNRGVTNMSGVRSLTTGTPGPWMERGWTGTSINPCPAKGGWNKNRVDNVQLQVQGFSGTANWEVAQLWAEVYIDNSANAMLTPRRQWLDAFEADFTDYFAASSDCVMSTNQARSGVQSMRINLAANGIARLQPSFSDASVESFQAVWVYVAAYPTVSCSLVGQGVTSSVQTVTRLNSDGSILIEDNTGAIGSASAAGVVPLNTWTLIEMRSLMSLTTTSLDGEVEIRVNGTTILTSTSVKTANTSQSSGFVGNIRSSQGAGMDIYFDDYSVDNTDWVGSKKFGVYLPTGAGSKSGSGFAAVGAATQREAMDDHPTNDATDYTTTGTSTSGRGSYTWSGLASPNMSRGIKTYARVMRDGASNGSLSIHMMSPQGGDVSGSLTATSASWGWIRVQQGSVIDYLGTVNRDVLNACEMEIRNASANTSRVSTLMLIVEYDEQGASPVLAKSQVVMAG